MGAVINIAPLLATSRSAGPHKFVVGGPTIPPGIYYNYSLQSAFNCDILSSPLPAIPMCSVYILCLGCFGSIPITCTMEGFIFSCVRCSGAANAFHS